MWFLLLEDMGRTNVREVASGGRLGAWWSPSAATFVSAPGVGGLMRLGGFGVRLGKKVTARAA